MHANRAPGQHLGWHGPAAEQASPCCYCRHIGGGPQPEQSRAMDVDYGGMNFEISQLDAVLTL